MATGLLDRFLAVRRDAVLRHPGAETATVYVTLPPSDFLDVLGEVHAMGPHAHVQRPRHGGIRLGPLDIQPMHDVTTITVVVRDAEQAYAVRTMTNPRHDPRGW
jgi:hypothetical protein